jgi:hypothetical protein
VGDAEQKVKSLEVTCGAMRYAYCTILGKISSDLIAGNSHINHVAI